MHKIFNFISFERSILKLTIGITTYQETVFLEELLFTINQELKINNHLNDMVEIFLYNDCTQNQETLDIIKKYSNMYNLIIAKKNHGMPSFGRNKILEKAIGEYILFIDGDDNFISPINNIIAELNNTIDKDVLVSEVKKIQGDGILTYSPFIYTHLLFNCSDDFFDQNYHKLIVHQTGIWSIYRTQFLKENNFIYDTEHRYEDNLFMTQLALNNNTRFGRLNTSYYGWRNNLNSYSHTNQDQIIKSRLFLYEQTLREVEKNINSNFSPYLLFSIWNQTYTNLIKSYPNLNQKQRKYYFNQLNLITKKNNKLVNQLMNRTDDLTDKYFKLRKYKLFNQYFILNNLSKLYKIKINKVKYKHNLLKVFTILPINRKKIFFTSQYGKYNDNSKYLYLEMKNNPKYKNFKFIFAVNDRNLIKHKDFIDFHNKVLYFYHHYTSSHIYFNTWYDPNIKKRKQQTWTQLWHGIPYKKVYTDINTYEQTTPLFKTINKQKSISNWDNVWSVNAYNTNIFKNLFPNVYIIEKEYPKVQWLIDNQNNLNLIEKLKDKYQLDQFKKYILYAPTYRPYQYFINISEVKKIVPDGYELLVHKHPMLRTNKIKDIGELKDIDDIQEIILITDGVITDCSSIKYDYRQMNKKTIEYFPDKVNYDHIHGIY